MAAPGSGALGAGGKLPPPPPCTHPAYNPDWWFAPEDLARLVTVPADAETAARICETQCERACREACFAGAKARREPFGIWGGVLFDGGVPVSLEVLRLARRVVAA